MRSLKVAHQYIKQVKEALRLNGYPRQIDLAEELGLSLSTVSNFLNGRAIDALNFYEICQKLAQDPKQITNWEKPSQDRGIYKRVEVKTESQVEVNINYQIKSIYIPRATTEELCNEAIKKPGALLRIKGTKGIGKTSLVRKLLELAAEEGYNTVFLGLQLADKSLLQNLEKFLEWFCLNVTLQLQLPNKLADYWDDLFGSKISCTIYFKDYLLTNINQPIVLGLDDLDLLFQYPDLANDFLSLLRVWHHEAKTGKIWEKLRLIVVHTTEMYIPLHVIQSPFNVGLPIELSDFTPEQVQDLAKRQQINWNSDQVQQIMDMVGGHPYLLQMAIDQLKFQKITLAELLQDAPTEAGIYNHHLRELLGFLEDNEELAKAMKTVVDAPEAVPLKPIIAFKLKSLGLVHLQGNKVKLSYNLYRLYFRTHLLQDKPEG